MERLSKAGCPITQSSTLGGASAATPASCFGVSGVDVHFLPYRTESGTTVVRRVVVSFYKDDSTFNNLVRSFTKDYGEPTHDLETIRGDLLLAWSSGELRIRLFQAKIGVYGFVEYASGPWEAKIFNESRAKANAGAAGG